MIAVIKKKIEEQRLGNVRVQHLDLDRDDILEGRYHLITSSMTFHHIRDVPLLLGRLYEVTAPGGHLCVADLDPDGGRFHGDNQDGVFHDGFDRAEMRRLLASAGFRDINARTAATVEKPVPGGRGKFTIFLVTGRKH